MEYPKWKENGRIKLAIIVGTRPEIIRLAAVITKARKYFDTQLWHTGQNYDYNLNGIFFRDLGLADPELYLDVVGDDLGATMGNIIDRSYKAMAATKPDAVLVLGDTNSCLSVIGAKRRHGGAPSQRFAAQDKNRGHPLKNQSLACFFLRMGSRSF